MAATRTKAPAAAPQLDDDLDYAFEELRGYGHGIDQILDGLRWIALRAHTTDSTQTHIAVLGGNCPNITNLIAEVIARLGDPAQNPALRDLPADRQNTVKQLTEQYRFYDEEFAPREIASEACVVIEGN